jgi:signal transduction histidine kinase
VLLGWVGRVVGGRFGPARLLPLLICPGYLLLLEPAAPGLAGWAVVLASAGLFLAGGVWPLAVAVGESLLVVVASQVPDMTAVTVKVLAGVTLFELAIRRPLRHTLIAAAAQCAVYFAVVPYEPTLTGILGVCYRLVVVVGAPMLLGAYLRSSVQAVAQARARAADAEERRELAARSARQAERTEIARELHDLVAHHVSSMALRVGVARAVVPDLDQRVGAVLDDVHSSAKTTLADLRRLLTVLRDPAAGSAETRSVLVDPAELPAAVMAVIDRCAQAGLEVDRYVDPRISSLDSVRGLAVLRLVQEGLTNATKHAGAGATAAVRVEVLDGEARVEVTDDGGTPDQRSPLPAAGSGYGLIGLRERVELVSGTLAAGRSGRGWRLRATLPMPTTAVGTS